MLKNAIDMKKIKSAAKALANISTFVLNTATTPQTNSILFYKAREPNLTLNQAHFKVLSKN